jgi:hypothetical protein
MTSTSAFDYDRFVALTGQELVSYVDPLVNDRATMVAKEDLARMLSDLPSYDEYHLVYALELGAAHSPEAFAPHLPQYLSHKEGSVCCSAFNALNALPDKCVTQELVESVHRVVTSQAVRKFVTEVLESLTRRMLDQEAKGKR